MKVLRFHILTLIFISSLVFSSCSKKDRNPTLIVAVKDNNNIPLANATVRVWPTDQLVVTSSSSGVPDERMDRIGLTDANGEISFEFPSSAVLDIDVTYDLYTSDTDFTTLEGHKVVQIEVKRQKDEENIFTELIYVD